MSLFFFNVIPTMSFDQHNDYWNVDRHLFQISVDQKTSLWANLTTELYNLVAHHHCGATHGDELLELCIRLNDLTCLAALVQ